MNPMSSDRYEERVDTAIVTLEEMMSAHRWEEAATEAMAIQQRFPKSKRVQNLQNRVKSAWRQQKQRLEQQFLDAAAGDDPRAALALFRRLDRYLTPTDAPRFADATQTVIAKLKENLSVSFRMAVNEQDWVAATDTGEQIIKEFPNSQMAHEARSTIELLRERALAQRHTEIAEQERLAKEAKRLARNNSNNSR